MRRFAFAVAGALAIALAVVIYHGYAADLFTVPATVMAAPFDWFVPPR
ncbi:hypothetical protein Sme01_10830 [Sphaerisporangium melleum]|uniref:Uncharacterized protein n=2 Tax=Sphaerisporangium melleum TaxID=321316 RepID=A0A917QT07_9ACTN|nr:hypothetical protein GCM10007964_06790 [Sphaerisporangium melleum]GII68607.1 hypothetical protein Sme01_10830 [Sphaerisporangium melleum]